MSADVFCYGLGVNLHHGLGAGISCKQAILHLEKSGKSGYNKKRGKAPKCTDKGDMDMSKKPTVLMILDGYGLRDDKHGNAWTN